jgi:cell division protein FtsL
MNSRLNVLLMLVLVASALYLVRTSYEARQLFVALERARSAATKLGQESERLQIERRASSTHQRVEQVAQERLHMRRSSPAVTQYVEAPTSGATGGTP